MRIALVGPGDAALIHRITQEAFAKYRGVLNLARYERLGYQLRESVLHPRNTEFSFARLGRMLTDELLL